MDNNSAIMAQVFIDVLGEETVSKFLDNNTNTLFFITVDSLGFVKKIERLNTNKEVPFFLKDIIEDYLITKRVRFYICYEVIPGSDYNKSFKRITKELKGQEEYFIYVSFPGTFMVFYEIDTKKADKKHQNLTKLDYLKSKIKIFYPQYP